MNRRSYKMEDGFFKGARKVEVVIRADGRTVAQMALRNPGVVSVIAKKNGDTVLDVVEPSERRFTDVLTPDVVAESMPRPWQLELLGES